MPKFKNILGNISEGVKKKLFSNRQVRCSGESCNKIENLGPFDSSISDTGGFKSLCEDRRECVECSNVRF